MPTVTKPKKTAKPKAGAVIASVKPMKNLQPPSEPRAVTIVGLLPTIPTVTALDSSSVAAANVALQPIPRVAAVIDELKILQRDREAVKRTKIMLGNRLKAVIASADMGYHTGLTEAERKALFKLAGERVEAMMDRLDEDPDAMTGLEPMIHCHAVGLRALEVHNQKLRKLQEKAAAKLPVAAWRDLPEQKGFGLPSLAMVVGECGDLSLYPNPAKLWKRMGCAPFTSQGRTKAGSTWRRGQEGSLSAEEWSQYGYSPRRRSLAYNIGQTLVKGNYLGASAVGEGDEVTSDTDVCVRPPGPYRARYLEAKAKFQEAHPDYPKKRCDYHGQLLAVKLLLKNLWIEWHKLTPGV